MTEAPGAVDRSSLLHRGTLDLCVLAVLDEEPLHAYGVVQRLAEHGLADVSYGTVYPLVTRLRRAGLVDQSAARGQGGPARNVLSLTPSGRTALASWTDQWRRHTAHVTAVLDSTTERQGSRDAG